MMSKKMVKIVLGITIMSMLLIISVQMVSAADVNLVNSSIKANGTDVTVKFEATGTSAEVLMEATLVVIKTTATDIENDTTGVLDLPPTDLNTDTNPALVYIDQASKGINTGTNAFTFSIDAELADGEVLRAYLCGDNGVTLVYADTKEDDVEYGEISGDGTINIADVSMLYQAVRGIYTLDDSQKLAADVLFDGTLNIGDVSVLYQYIRGIISTIPVIPAP